MDPSTIGRYEIEKEVAQGGMGIIYLARDPYVHRQVVIKVLTYRHTLDEIYRQYFQQEAEIIAALEHPCIVPVYDFGWLDQQPYIVMRHMSGGTLEDRLQAGGIKLSDASHVLQRVAQALDASHAQGIIHRDVKPSNILFDGHGESFLSDFGIAKGMRLSDDEGEWILGTPAYMSPEQVMDEGVDGRADIYALGIILYRILTGQLPFSPESVTSLIRAQLETSVPQIRDVKSDVPAVWQEVVSKALAKQPDDRYATAGEFAAEVEQIASGRWFLRRI